MEKILNMIWKFLNSRLFAYIGIVLLVILFVGNCNRISDLNDTISTKNKNIEVLNDTVKTVKLKNGDLQSTVGSFQAKNKELKLLNESLYNEVKKRKTEVVTLNRIVFQLKQDTSDLQKYIDYLEGIINNPPPEKLNDTTWNIPWNMKFSYDSLNYDFYSGVTTVGLRGQLAYINDILLTNEGTRMLNRESQMELIWGQEYEGKGKNRKLRVYAETAHPAFITKLLEGTYVDYPEKRHWFTGFGIGPNLGVGYDFINSQPTLTVGLGIHYSIYSW